MVHEYSTEDVKKIASELPPEFTPHHDLDTSRLSEFFSKKASIDIFILLTEYPKPFDMIDDNVPASRTTVSKRLMEGVEIGLWAEDIQYTEDNKRIKLYCISKDAKDISDRIADLDLVNTYKTYIEAKYEYEDLCGKMRSVVDNDN